MKIKGTEHHFIRTDDSMNDVHRLVDYAYNLKEKSASSAYEWVSDNCETEEIIKDDCHLKSYSLQALNGMKKREALGFTF